MSTAYSSAKQKYIGNGVTTEWGFDFPIKKHSELKVYLKRSSLPQVLLEEGVDYSFVTENTIAFPIKTGESKLQATDVLALQRESVFESEYNFSNQQRLEPEEVMHADDNLERQIQELKRDSESAIKVQPTSNINTDEYFIAVESIYENLDNITNVSGISAEIVNCSNNIEAIQDAPNQANAASQSASNAAQSATNASQSATNAAQSATNAANSATASASSATASATSAQAAQDALNDVQGLIATPIGTIFQSIYVDESMDIARQLNGQLISSTKFTGFRSWLNTVQTAAPNLFTTETNWQAEKTNSKLGQCGKFVIDDTAGTIRLPCVVNAQGLADLALIGSIKSESLPNITGDFGNVVGNNATDCFEIKSSRNLTVDGTNSRQTSVVSFDASRSSSTYQDNAPVQQEAVQYPYYIQVATGVEETLPAIREYKTNVPYVLGDSKYFEANPYNASWLESNGQYNSSTVYPDLWSQLQVELNSSLNVGDTIEISGKTYVKRGLPVKLSTDTYDDYDFVVNQSDQTFRLPLLNGSEDLPSDRYDNLTLQESGSTYTAPANGWFSLNTWTTSTATAYYQLRNLTSDLALLTVPDQGHGYQQKGFIPCKAGDVVTFIYANIDTTRTNWHFVYAKGNGSLYFYVGDTVQDASLINAGAVLGQLSTKTNSVEAAAASMPSNGYIDLTLGASGSNYTAPANGFICIAGSTTNNGYYQSDKSQYFTMRIRSGTAGGLTSLWFPVKKGQIFNISYINIDSNFWFRFIYAEGEN